CVGDRVEHWASRAQRIAERTGLLAGALAVIAPRGAGRVCVMTRAGSADFDPPKKTAPPGSADFELEKNAGFEVGVDGNANSGFEAGANRFANSGFAELSTVVFTKIPGSMDFELMKYAGIDSGAVRVCASAGFDSARC